jgi:hypothetical protein
MAGTKFYGSICITDLLELANKKHSAFSRADNGKIYADVNVWLNDEKDKYGNIMSIQLNPKKDLRELDGQPYIGNCKESERKPISGRDASELSITSDIPAREKNNTPANSPGVNAANEITEPIDDLPF